MNNGLRKAEKRSSGGVCRGISFELAEKIIAFFRGMIIIP
jgi:hypothetical protein